MTAPLTVREAALPEYISSRIGSPDENGCWPWMGPQAHGYGRAYIKRRAYRAHRVVYEILRGPIPDGLVIDHLCRNRRCVNPDHMEPVTIRENTMRGENHIAKNHLKTECPNGHPYSPENTQTSGGYRRCRACDRRQTMLANRKYRARLRTALAAAVREVGGDHA